MKHSLLLPFGFLLKMLGFSLLFSLLMVFHSMLPTAEGGRVSEGFLIYSLAADMPSLVLASALMAFIMSLFSIVKRPGIKVVSFLLLILVSWLGIYFGMLGAATLSGSVRRAETELTVPFEPGQIYRTKNGLVRLGGRSGAIARNVILIETDAVHGAFSFHEEVVYDPDTRALRSIATSEQIILLEDSNPLPVHSILELWLDGLKEMSADLSPSQLYDAEALINTIVLGLLLLSLWLFVRFSRWPLFNFFLVLGLLWAGVALYKGAGIAARDLAQSIGVHDAYAGLVLPVLTGSAALIMLTFCIFRKPLREWRKEMGYE